MTLPQHDTDDRPHDTTHDTPNDTPHETPREADGGRDTPSDTPGSGNRTPVGAMQGRLREALASGAFASGGDGALLGVPVTMRAVLGEARVPVSRFLALGPGDTLSLNRLVGEPIDVTVNDAVIARGEIVMLDEETGRLGVRVVSLSDAA